MDTTTPAPDPIPPCPRCGAAHVVRNGTLRSGSPNFLCRGCGRNFVAAPKKGPVAEERKALIRRLLLERLSLRAIARVAGVSRSWLQGFVNELYREETPVGAGGAPKKGRAG
jgi:transposase-like protein